jgi:hypothetical protein
MYTEMPENGKSLQFGHEQIHKNNFRHSIDANDVCTVGESVDFIPLYLGASSTPAGFVINTYSLHVYTQTCQPFNIWSLKISSIFRDSVRTSQETHNVSTTETNRLMLFGETVAVYCENHMEHINILFNYAHSGPSHLSSLEISWIKCDTAFAFILPWHVSISFDHVYNVYYFRVKTVVSELCWCIEREKITLWRWSKEIETC